MLPALASGSYEYAAQVAPSPLPRTPVQIGCLFTHVTGCYCIYCCCHSVMSILYKSCYLRSLLTHLLTGYRFIGPIIVTIRSECSVNSLIDLYSTRDRDSPPATMIDELYMMPLQQWGKVKQTQTRCELFSICPKRNSCSM